VVDALFKKYEEEGYIFVLFLLVLDWIAEVCQEWMGNAKVVQLLQPSWEPPHPLAGYIFWQHNTLRYTGHIFLV